ncbi:hypothetical protein [Rhodococcus sp. IEGM 1318]|uniref:hypothetical protein n=1 Tax=Rhodococcus sp. IEGM 1318 TaxID=3082226 RepID=UPI002953AA9A|nr:hypothetical protein [Rhodococcus sp. IEGM 1318]MDV8009004.1 hypothetical protein [Rhodococcus sp. IEGM 1318]MDV8009514.1 hypothetical protein [Rhodococcus sp. IEGM 1318]
MQWWTWLIIVIVIAALAVGAFIAIQAHRRTGGVIISDPDTSTHGGDEENGSPR